jgi:acyl transferase domain-containing protein/NAD(P)-dependent dehydrogenase (short-subunit alcohol dehydrogenase family)
MSKIKNLKKKVSENLLQNNDSDIAIIGMSCKFPGANNYNEFWNNLESGINSIREIPIDRWELKKYNSKNGNNFGYSINRWCGLIEDIDKFDNRFFNISPREAENMDPQQRLLLEETWHCIEDSGISIDILREKKTSVYVGCMTTDYHTIMAENKVEVDNYSSLGNFENFLSNRISYQFGLSGISITLSAACATSLVAIHEAKGKIISGECDYSIVGGVNLNLHPWKHISFSKSMMLSPSGQCKTFDQGADGYIPGDGVGVILLQRLSDAITEKNQIYGIIKGSAVNHVGHTMTITAPSVKAQKEVILAAYKDAGINPETVNYVEAHGTGTSLGDPIEIEGLRKAFQEYTSKKEYCKIGSVKSNIGHLESAAGIAGVIKVLLMMKYRKIVKTLNVKELNPIIEFSKTPFAVAREASEWKGIKKESLLRAGVSSFGFGGVNGHVIIESYTEQKNGSDNNYNPKIFLLSAKTSKSLRLMIDRWRSFIKDIQIGNYNISDICANLMIGRRVFSYRFGIYAKDISELNKKLRQTNVFDLKVENRSWGLHVGEFGIEGYTEVKDLIEKVGVIRQKIEEIINLVEVDSEKNKLSKNFLMTPWPSKKKNLYAFIVGYAYINTFIKLGFTPSLITGENIGIWLSLVISGILKLEDALDILGNKKEISAVKFYRPKIPFYDPLSDKIFYPFNFKEKYLEKVIRSMTFSEEIIERDINKAQKLYSYQYTFKRYLDEWNASLAKYNRNIESFLEYPKSKRSNKKETILLYIIILSSLQRLNEKWDLKNEYLSNQELSDLINLFLFNILSKEELIELLLSKKPELSKIIEKMNARQRDIDTWSLYEKLHNKDNKLEGIEDVSEWIKKSIQLKESSFINKDLYQVYFGNRDKNNDRNNAVYIDTEKGMNSALFDEVLLSLWLKGVDIKWKELYIKQGINIKKLSLPTYPFDRERFWIISNDENEESTYFTEKEEVQEVSIVQYNKEIESEKGVVYYRDIWVEKEIEKGITKSSESILIFDNTTDIFEAINKGSKNENILVLQGNQYKKVKRNVYELNPSEAEEYYLLLEDIRKNGSIPDRIIHIWSQNNFTSQSNSIKKQLNEGIYSIFYLTQSLMHQKLNKAIKLLYIYNNDTEQPLYASMGSFIKTLHLENPIFHYKVIQVSFSYYLKEEDKILGIIEREFENFSDIEVSYEKEERKVRKLEEVILMEKDERKINIRENGVYLITGGCGELGLIFAEYLAGQNKVHLILTGRSSLNKEKQNRIKEIETLGSDVLYMQSDISKQSEVKILITSIKKKYGEINGIIHCAGIEQNAFIYKKTREEISSVFESKIFGSIYLDEATKNEKIDFFVFFSSITAMLGNVGQSDYAYANRFMNYYGKIRNGLCASQKRSGKTLVVNWPIWQEGGMKVEDGFVNINILQPGIILLSTKIGLDIWGKAIKSEQFHLFPIYGDIEKIRSIVTLSYHNINRNDDIKINFNPEVMYEKTYTFLRETFKKLLKIPVDQIQEDVGFEEYGINSLIIGQFNGIMEEYFKLISKTLLFEYRTLRDLVNYFIENHKYELGVLFGLLDNYSQEEERDKGISTSSEGEIIASNKVVERDERWNNSHENEIAIIGVSGRYPMAENIEEFWENLKRGRDSVTEVPKERWDWEKYYDPDPNKAEEGKIYCKWGGFLKDIEVFDPLFFNISPREAKEMDPQERILLEEVWRVFENAGYTQNRLGTYWEQNKYIKTGVFIGVTTITHPYASPWSLANRVSYVFNLSGPSIPVDTGCSSSLTAVHFACESIKKGECDYALAGGVNIYSHLSKINKMCKMKMLSIKGHCHSFGYDADGFVPGEGVGVVLLKSLKKAEEDGDNIYAIIKGSAINNDGKTIGYTVPNPNAHVALIEDVIKSSGINPRSISYIEAHGTGTMLGDPIEVNSLSKIFRKYTGDRQFCAIGSVKSNIGHCESAAGISGLTKVLLQLKYKKIVPSLHSEVLNPNIDFDKSPFIVQQKLSKWKRPVIEIGGKNKEYPRIAGISSFGAGGANAHIIIEEYISKKYDESPISIEKTSPELIILSAKNKERVKVYAKDLLDYLRCNLLKSHPISISDIAYTLQIGREAMEERIAIIANDNKELIDLLLKYCDDKESREYIYSGNIKKVSTETQVLIDGKEGQEFINTIMRERKLKKLACLWISGIDIDWRLLRNERRKMITNLPTYPFLRESFGLMESKDYKSDIKLNNGARGDSSKIENTDIITKQYEEPSELMTFKECLEEESVTVNSNKKLKTLICMLSKLKNQEIFSNKIHEFMPDLNVIFISQERNTKDKDNIKPRTIKSYNLDKSDSKSYINIIKEINRDYGKIDVLLYLWALEDSKCIEDYSPIVYILQALAVEKQKPERLLLVGQFKDLLERSYLDSWIGFKISLGLVLPNTKIAVIYSEFNKYSMEKWSELLWGEVYTLESNNIFYQNDKRYTYKIKPTKLEKKKVEIRSGGIYLITGGLGGLGYIFAEYLAKKYKAILVLTGRSSLDIEKKDKIKKLEALGSKVKYIKSDVCDFIKMSSEIKEVKEIFGRINGVIHAAGIQDKQNIFTKDMKDFERVLEAKIKGALVLDRIFKKEQLDFICYFSSSAAILGDFGYCDYAIANRFMMGYAHYRENNNYSGKSIVINWPQWRDGGMLIGDDDITKMYLKSSGQAVLETEEGIEIFEKILSQEEMQHLIIKGKRSSAYRFLGVSSVAQINKEEQKLKSPPIIFILAGQGSQYINICRDLYEKEKRFKELMDEMFKQIKDICNIELKSIIYPKEEIEKGKIGVVEDVEISQFILFSVEYSLARLLIEYGVKPYAIIGYSFGEYIAACLSGVFSIEDVIKLIYNRGQLLKETIKGAMLSVPASKEEINPYLNKDVYLAIDNGISCVVSGKPEAVKELEKELKKKRYFCVPVTVPYAIHSGLIKPILKRFEEKFKEFKLSAPNIPFISNLTGTWIKGEDAKDKTYWSKHLSSTVLFADGLRTLVDDKRDSIFIEIGPGRDLSMLVERFIEENKDKRIIDTIRPAYRKISDKDYFDKKIKRLADLGVVIDEKYLNNFINNKIVNQAGINNKNDVEFNFIENKDVLYKKILSELWEGNITPDQAIRINIIDSNKNKK